jgi:DNA-binding winged helix-turn-helix (wHTH) protein/tetratricopeptide (TPR) repeat protein
MASFPPFRLDLVNQCLWRGETRISLMPKPFAVLTYLVEHAGQLVTHEELLAAIWPDTYVQPEVLRRYILEIRRVLGDNAETPRFILTLPKRGYQFIAPLKSDDSAERARLAIATPAAQRLAEERAGPAPNAPAASAPNQPPARRVVVWASLAVAAVVAASLVTLYDGRPQALRDRDSIMLGSFENKAGEPVFDWTLRQGLAAQLSQSPFLHIVPEERVRETLRLMGRAPDDPLTHEVALEVCRRQGVKAMLEGSIAPLGQAYVLALQATGCQSGEAIAREQAQAERKESVLATLGRLASHLRGTLGESLASIQRFDVALEQMTTPSLEALQAYTYGQRSRARGEEIESIALFQRAVELDPRFASAYASLSTIYSNLGEADRAVQYAQRAYEHRDRVSARERLSITYQYYDQVTGDLARATEALEVWKQSFPREYQPVNSLALIHNFLGRFERAVEEGHEAIRRNPSHGFPYSNLANAYRGLGRFDEARRTAERAVALRIETLPTRRLLYQLAVMAGDEAAAAQQLEWARNKAREFDMVGVRAQAAAFGGRVREARELYEQTLQMAERAGLPDVGTGHLAAAMSMDLAYGNLAQAAQEARRILTRRPSFDPKLRAALGLARTGATAEAEAIAGELVRAHPEHTTITLILAPMVRAAVELRRQRPERTIDQLRACAPYELGFIAALRPLDQRGRAYLMQGAGREAAREFQRIIDHRGVDPFSPFYATAPLGLARARALVGDAKGSLQAYEEFLAQWAEADPDVPLLLDARREYGDLKRREAATEAR